MGATEEGSGARHLQNGRGTVRPRRSRILLQLSMLAVGMACSSSCAHERPSRMARLPHDPARGFYQLFRAIEAPHIRCGTSEVAEDTEELASAWSFFGFPGKAPRVDFSAYRVVFYVAPAPCGGGESSGPVRALHVFGNGRLTPEYGLTDGTCYIIGRIGPCRGEAYALAVRRERTPEEIHVELDPSLTPVLGEGAYTNPPDSECVDESSTNDKGFTPGSTTPCAMCSWDKKLLAGEHTQWDASSTAIGVPPYRSVALETLEDGSPVFVVHHADRTVSVLAADYEAVSSILEPWPRGLRLAVQWHCGYWLFSSYDGGFDEYGISKTGRVRGLDRYAFEETRSEPPSLRILRRERAVSGRKRALPPSDRRPKPPRCCGTIYPFVDHETRTLEEARTGFEGSWYVFRARLRFGGGSAPHFCSGSACGPNRPRAFGLTASDPDRMWMIGGEFAARPVRGGFRDIIWLGWPGAPEFAEMPELADIRQRQDDADRVRAAQGDDRTRPEAAASAHVAYTEASWRLGPDARLGVRMPLHPWEEPFGLFLFGDYAGGWLRARALRDATSNGGWVGMVGVDASFEEQDRRLRWVYPTVVSTLLPEAGVSWSSGTSLYLSWSLPVSFRFAYPPWRQLPHRISDFMGLEVTPSFTVFFGDADAPWAIGMSAGVVAW